MIGIDDEERSEFQIALEDAVEKNRQDSADRRTLSGKYAPETGICRVCGGKVVAEISYPNDGRIGGPPTRGYISGWHCEGCYLVYWGIPRPPK